MLRVTNTRRISQIKLKLMFSPLGAPRISNMQHCFFFSTSIYKKLTVLISRVLIVCAREPLVFVWRNSRFNIGISDYNTEEGLSPKRLLTFSFLTLKRVFLISLL